MSLATSNEIVAAAVREGVGVGAFNVIQLEHIEAVVAGAERAGRPVILQISENAVRYHGALGPTGLAALAAARAAGVPVAVHLDHAESAELVAEAVQLGLTSVMFDGARLPYRENVAATAAAVALCRSHGVSVEAELGEIGGKDGAHAPGVRTDPAEAHDFATATGVDALAVAVGSSHAMSTRDAELDFGLIAELRAAVPVPLVLHGSSGVADEDLVRAVAAGISKVNIGTHLNRVFTRELRARLDAGPELVDPRTYFTPAREAVTEEVARLLRVLAGGSRTAA
ncbi:class II fructose-bisphosphate aldolase [Kitasatospora herbaricolor]|uniref:Class II fructose-bisphosphate aldolase family protein n=1 Tax=Kitasatospora herbaricolor TaxID=68217 RepID=A0ABZ1WDZ7_9ACTN|nr:class II fructose-bisphosphate aldolase [Kitasatospora herbaricolor]